MGLISLDKEGKMMSSLRNTYLRRELIFTIDIILSLTASLIVLLGIDSLFSRLLLSSKMWVVYLTTSVVVSIMCFLLTHTAKIIIRHFGVKDVVPYVEASFGKGVVLFVVLIITQYLVNYTSNRLKINELH